MQNKKVKNISKVTIKLIVNKFKQFLKFSQVCTLRI